MQIISACGEFVGGRVGEGRRGGKLIKYPNMLVLDQQNSFGPKFLHSFC